MLYSGRQKACSDFLQNNINDKNEMAVLVLNCIIQDDFVGGYIRSTILAIIMS